MSKFNLKNIIKKVSRVRGKDKLKAQIRPYRDWVVLLVIFFILLTFLAVVNVYLFTIINKEEIFAEQRPAGEEVEMLDTDTLKSTIEFFDGRSENFDKLLKQKPGVVDPSR
jgi:hypothetical protein